MTWEWVILLLGLGFGLLLGLGLLLQYRQTVLRMRAEIKAEQNAAKPSGLPYGQGNG